MIKRRGQAHSTGSGRVHFTGIGGIGVSALARYFLSEGWKVGGSDLVRSPITDELKKDGAAIYIGKHAANKINKNVSLVIHTQAAPKDHPELAKARLSGKRPVSYPEAIGELTRKYKTIAIAGSHGKSTTTGMTALILTEAGLDPTVIIGTKLPQFGNKNFRKGKSGWLVLEADEWRGAFWHYSPIVAAITNIDAEHLDFYKNFSGVKKSFQRFFGNILPSGIVFINKQHSNILQNVRMLRKNLFSENDPMTQKIKKVLRISGKHNVLNALVAYRIGRYLGIPEKIILRALGKYTGAWRRMEYRGKLEIGNWKLEIFDDYAHHPTEIKATLAAFKEKWPKTPLICVYQAHQLERLKLLYNSFKTAFKEADRVIILPTYQVAGRERLENKKQKIENRILTEKLAKDIGAIYVNDPVKNLKKVLTETLNPKPYTLDPKPHTLDPIVVMMGAGNIADYTQELIS